MKVEIVFDEAEWQVISNGVDIVGSGAFPWGCDLGRMHSLPERLQEAILKGMKESF